MKSLTNLSNQVNIILFAFFTFFGIFILIEMFVTVRIKLKFLRLRVTRHLNNFINLIFN
jgi:hypothetical protein